jgi:hypothetical protein
MALNIQSGKKYGAIRGVLYGVEGIGKSTLATRLPDSLVLDAEDGTRQIDCSRTLVCDWRGVEEVIRELSKENQGFKTLVIDTADAVERLLIDHILKTSGKKSIEDFGFGKGYTLVAERWNGFLGSIDGLIRSGVNVLFIAHSKVVKHSPPDQTDGFDRYELKMTKQVGPLLKEWSDLLLFAKFRVQIVEGSDGRLKAQGGTERILFTSHTAAWDAKNRFGLEPEIAFSVDSISHLFTGAGIVQEAPKAAPAPEPEPEEALPPLATRSQVNAILAHSQSHAKQIDATLEEHGAMSVDELTWDQAALLIATFPKPTPEKAEPLKAKLTKHADKVNTYLVSIGWIQKGEGWEQLTNERMEKIIATPDKFFAKAGVSA